MTPRERLELLKSLPCKHQDFFWEQVRARCEQYSKRYSRGDPSAGELVSEVWWQIQGKPESPAKAIREEEEEGEEHGDGSPEDADDPPEAPATWLIDEVDPEKDGRVQYLLKMHASHRTLYRTSETMRRNRWRRWKPRSDEADVAVGRNTVPAGPYRTVQMEALPSSHVGPTQDPTQDRALNAGDDADALQGLFKLAERDFARGDDEHLLLLFLKHRPDLWDEFGANLRGAGKGKVKWPVATIVTELNSERPNRPWDGDRLENAKRRLASWLQSIAKRLGSKDATDVVAFLAAVGRNKSSAS